MGEFSNMKKENIVPTLVILGVIDAELSMYFGEILTGLEIHVINLLAIILIVVFGDLDIDVKNVLQSIVLLVLLRISNIAVPQIFVTTMLQYPLIYGIMLIPIYYIINGQKMPGKELGMIFNKLYIYIPLALIIGSMAAIVEYVIMKPVALIDSIRLPSVMLISIIMVIFVGIIEEVMFRSILQTRLEKTVGWKYGILISGIVFGVMNASYGIGGEVVFATIFGIVLGYIFYMTKSLPFNVLIRGVANVVLFGILPFYGSYIVR